MPDDRHPSLRHGLQRDPPAVKTRHLLAVVFALAFAFGAAGALVYLNHPPPPAQTSAKPTAANPDPGKPESDNEQAAPKWPEDAGSPEQVMYAQAQLMQTAIGQLVPRTPGHPNLYMIAFAGDGNENVFRNEVEFVERQFTQRFDSAGHVITLINNPGTLTSTPLASLSNLQTALDAVAERMDQEQDIVFLFLTSHGSREHELYVNLEPLPLDQIGPDDLADLFADTHIRHRVIVISACYSGGFIDALKNDTTMIVTASREDRASFGCGTDSDITDFGRAFFVDGMNHNDSFKAAYAEAAGLIDSWETRDDEEHSYPQFVSTAKIETQLKAWRAGIKLGPPLPFKTSTPKADTVDSLTAMR
jgi:hypothetical protein